MLERGGNNVLFAFLFPGKRSRNYGLIVRFAAAGSEIYFAGFAAEIFRYARARPVQFFFCFLSYGVQAGRISVVLVRDLNHFFGDRLALLGSRRVICVNFHKYLLKCELPIYQVGI